MPCFTVNVIHSAYKAAAPRTCDNHDCTLKNLFTEHFQFDLLKLETNNTCDDKVKHAWIIAR
jgi:hypothetical protein